MLFRSIDETERRRSKQMLYNERHGITPTQIVKNTSASDLIDLYAAEAPEGKKAAKQAPAGRKTPAAAGKRGPIPYIEGVTSHSTAAEPVFDYMSAPELEKRINRLRLDMETAAKNTDFIQAAQYRDELIECQNRLQALQQKAEA